MSNTVHRVMLTAAGVAALGWFPAPAQAQADRGVVLNILIECAKIDDPTARLACYDNNIRSAGGTVPAVVPGRSAMPQGGGAPVAAGGAGFGRENIRTAQRFQPPAGQVQRITPSITAIAQREPGVYLLTLDDGAQWVFAQSVSSTYIVPRAGTTVEIERGSLGSFLLRVPGQPPVQVRRVR